MTGDVVGGGAGVLGKGGVRLTTDHTENADGGTRKGSLIRGELLTGRAWIGDYLAAKRRKNRKKGEGFGYFFVGVAVLFRILMSTGCGGLIPKAMALHWLKFWSPEI